MSAAIEAQTVKHVIALVRFKDNVCVCACGWQGEPDAFQTHRTEAKAGKTYSGSPQVVGNELAYQPTDPFPVTKRQGPKDTDAEPAQPRHTAWGRSDHLAPTPKEESMTSKRKEPADIEPGRSANGQPLAGGMNPTQRQRECWEAYHRHGSQTAAAKARGEDQGAIRSGVLGYMRAMGIDGPIPPAGHQIAGSDEQAPDEPAAATSLHEDLASTDHVPAVPDPVAAEAQVANASPAFDAIEAAADLAPLDQASARFVCHGVAFRSRESHDLRCPLHDAASPVDETQDEAEEASEPAVPLVADPEGATLVAPAEQLLARPDGWTATTEERMDNHRPICVCPGRPRCVPHPDDGVHQWLDLCADHDHAALDVTPPARSDDPAPETQTSTAPGAEWQRGYEEGYRASIETVDAMRGEQEYLRGFSMGTITTCLNEIRTLATPGGSIYRLAGTALAALGEL